jgi:A/G-specific adenine glycosylase
MDITVFQEMVWAYYAKHGRDLPWRKPDPAEEFDPYKILVSEIMLQQTQVSRVVPKYIAWLEQFPDVLTLAHGSLAGVLELWSGLGYNRRAKYLHTAAQQISSRGIFPNTVEDLTSLPGVGKNTAGAIMAYAYNQPIVFIETNIRTAYLYHFFHGQDDVDDASLYSFIEDTLDYENPREWYWALMDYGSYLKQEKGNFARASKHHVTQSVFQGSRRQVRGVVLRTLIKNSMTHSQLLSICDDDRLDGVLEDLQREGLIILTDKTYSLPQ